jgi:hypothetical protein
MNMDSDPLRETEWEPSALEIEATKDEVAIAPGDLGDPPSIIARKIPQDIRDRYEIYSYRNAAVILTETRQSEFEEILEALRGFSLTKRMIRTAGGNESEIPKVFSTILRPKQWHETIVQADLLVRRSWHEQTGTKGGKAVFEQRSKEVRRDRYLDGHKIDYVKERVAFDLEWNSKDQTFDRDLYAFSAFFQCGVIDAGILVTRSGRLNPVFRHLGQALKSDGVTPDVTATGRPRLTKEKYGASTTWMGKLLYRLNAGRNGGCPVLAIGITPECISDWTPEEKQAAERAPSEPDEASSRQES